MATIYSYPTPFSLLSLPSSGQGLLLSFSFFSRVDSAQSAHSGSIFYTPNLANLPRFFYHADHSDFLYASGKPFPGFARLSRTRQAQHRDGHTSLDPFAAAHRYPPHDRKNPSCQYNLLESLSHFPSSFFSNTSTVRTDVMLA